VVLWIADDHDPAPVCKNTFALGYRIHGVIRPLRMKIRPNRIDKLVHSRFAEDRHRIDTSQCADYLGALAFTYEWAPVSFQTADLLVGVQPDNEETAKLFCAFEIADMPGVDNVETAISKDYFRACGSLLCDELDELFSGQDGCGKLGHHI
jgi:hypothetical protein